MLKLLLTIFTLVFTVMFSSASFAEWTKVRESAEDIYYVDFESIKKIDGYAYFWTLRNGLKPTKWGEISSKIYRQVDCKLLRYKVMRDSYYKEPMGEGMPSESSNEPDKDWTDNVPNSPAEIILKSVCNW